jgi:polysaccharide export outer membrane protein
MVPGGKMVITRRDTSGKENTIEVDLYALLMNGDMSQNIQILSGDSIVISRKSTGQQIYVLGEVKNPGPYTVERDLTVLQALQMAGGFTDFADKGKAKVIRERNGVKKDIIVNLNKVRKGDKSQDITLEAGDVLVALRSWL